jgi:hypothetical protein
MKLVPAPGFADDRMGGVTITGTLRSTGAIKTTGTFLNTRLFRFELFFFADMPTGMANSTIISDTAMNDIRTGLTIFYVSF